MRARANEPHHKAQWWKLACETATFLRNHYDINRIAAAGDLVAVEPLNFWSELVLVVWGLPEYGTRYTSPQLIVRQLSEQPCIRLVDANGELTPAELQLLQERLVEL